MAFHPDRPVCCILLTGRTTITQNKSQLLSIIHGSCHNYPQLLTITPITHGHYICLNMTDCDYTWLTVTDQTIQMGEESTKCH